MVFHKLVDIMALFTLQFASTRRVVAPGSLVAFALSNSSRHQQRQRTVCERRLLPLRQTRLPALL